MSETSAVGYVERRCSYDVIVVWSVERLNPSGE